MSVLDLDELAEYISEKSGFSLDEANDYLDAENEYYFSIGLAGYDINPNEPVDKENAPCVEVEDICTYIEENTELDRKVIELFCEIEEEYLEENGFVESV